VRFTTIRYDGDTVSLKWEDTKGDAIDKHDWSCAEPPTPAFKASLAAFSSFVVGLIEAPAEWAEGLEIRQLALSEEKKTASRGLVVTALRKVSNAKGRTLLLNSPYMAEPPIGYNGPLDGYLSSAVLTLIEDAEAHAEAFRNGERGEQIDMNLPESENTKAVNQRMADAEVSSTRKPGKKKDAIAGVGTVFNPDSTELLDDAGLRQLLGSVDRDVPVDAIARFTSSERSLAEAWGRARQKEMTGQFDKLTAKERKLAVPAEPECVQKSATLPLSADDWTGPVPPKVDDAGAAAVMDAARH
jgi:hypothetical protein